jgi:hypothetical protein
MGCPLLLNPLLAVLLPCVDCFRPFNFANDRSIKLAPMPGAFPGTRRLEICPEVECRASPLPGSGLLKPRLLLLMENIRGSKNPPGC